MITNAWYVAGFSSQFERGELYGPTVARQPLVMWRNGRGELVAFDGRCRHKRFPLAKGKLIDDDTVECGYHGFCYDSRGKCTSAPAKGSEGAPTNADLQPYPVVEKDGLVWVWTGSADRAKQVGVPATPEIADPEWDTVASGAIDVAANWRLLIENLLDITHFYPLHADNIGDYANSKIPVRIERRSMDGNETIRTIRDAANYKLPPMMRAWFGYDVVDRHHTHHMLNPGLTRVELRVAPPGCLDGAGEKGYVLYHLAYPIDATHLRWWWVINCRREWTHSGSASGSLADAIAESFPSVVAQDRWALEAQQDMMVHADGRYEEVHIKTDGAVVLLRRIFEQLERQEADPDQAEIERLRTGRVVADEDLPKVFA